jgi:hypothetical protein
MNYRFASIITLCLVYFFQGCVEPEDEHQESFIYPQVQVESKTAIFWYHDSLLKHLLYPSTVQNNADSPKIVLISGVFDYTCTQFPEKFWGKVIYENSCFPSETLFCHSDTCWQRNGASIYVMDSYFANRADALCHHLAKFYTKNRFCYDPQGHGNSIRIYNSLIDTTVLGNEPFCLPRLPNDSLEGFWIIGTDKLFCPSWIIDNVNGTLNRQTIVELSSHP